METNHYIIRKNVHYARIVDIVQTEVLAINRPWVGNRAIYIRINSVFLLNTAKMPFQ